MNAEQVVKLANFNARELGLKWTITPSCNIRLKKDNREYCPIEVAGHFKDFPEASKDLGLSWTLETLIMRAADDWISTTDVPLNKTKALRELMLNTFEFEVQQ